MRDVTEQLADYFDSTVERITAEDVVAGRDTPFRPRKREPKATSRPAWALVFAFATTMLVVGVPLVIGLVLRAQEADVAADTAPPAYTIARAPGLWEFVVGAGAMLGLVLLVLAIRGAVTGNGGTAMTTTLTREPVETDIHRLKTTNRILMITAIVLGLLAIGFGTWAIVQATSAPENAVTENIQTLIDDYVAAWNNGDSEAFLELVTEDYHFDGGFGEVGVQIQARAIASPNLTNWQVETIGEPIMNGEDPWIVATSGTTTEEGLGTTHGISVLTIVDEGGTLKVDHHVWTDSD